MSLSEEVQQIVATTLDVEPTSISLETDQESLAIWDSLAHINVITALEARYGVEFEVEEIAAMNSVQAIVDHLENSGVT